jgi:hypothetical protein
MFNRLSLLVMFCATFPNILAAMLVLAISTATAQPQPLATPLTHAMPIATQGNGPYYRLTVPSSANAASQFADLRDLQVQNAAGLPVPFSWISGEILPSEITSTRVPIYAVPARRAEASADVAVGLKRGHRATKAGLNAQQQWPLYGQC